MSNTAIIKGLAERIEREAPAAVNPRSTGWAAPKDRYVVPVLFNPYSGEPRDARDIHSDPQGTLIAPPGMVDMLAAAPQQAPQAAQSVCQTCNGNGMIGGPSFYAPDEGGVPCPDCNQAAPIVRPLSDAVTDVLAERQRQIEVEGYTPEHDDEHCNGEIARAAAAYSLHAASALSNSPPVSRELSRMATGAWPWGLLSKKVDERSDLVKAGALILAEIERIDRAHGIKGD